MMRKAFYSMLPIILAIPTLGNAEVKQDRQLDEQQLRHIKTVAWPGFYRSQNAEGLGDFLDDSFVNIGPDGSAVSKSEELAAIAGELWNPVNFRYVVDRIDWHDNDLVTIIGRGTSDRTNSDGTACSHSYASSNLLRRAEGTKMHWKALSSHVSGVACTPAD